MTSRAQTDQVIARARELHEQLEAGLENLQRHVTDLESLKSKIVEEADDVGVRPDQTGKYSGLGGQRNGRITKRPKRGNPGFAT